MVIRQQTKIFTSFRDLRKDLGADTSPEHHPPPHVPGLKAFSRKIRPVKIRRYDAKDAVFLADLYVRSVQTIGPRHYSFFQVEAWLSLRPSVERLHQLGTDGRTRLVAADASDQPIAFADLENDGHIGFLYCSPEAAGTGVASALYDELERIARERGVIRLHSKASEAARRLFLRKGFVVTVRRRFEISGVPIHNYAVEKVLGNEETG